MMHLLSRSRSIRPVPDTAAGLAGLARLHHPSLLPGLLLAAGLFGVAQSAGAQTYDFSVTGGTITASGSIEVSNTGPLGASTVEMINGSFTDTANGISGMITGLDYAPAPTFNASPANTFNAPAFTDAGFSYDNLLWPAANSPAVCAEAPTFYGGYFDIYGLAFTVYGGYTVDLWSDGPDMGGYQLNESFDGTPFIPSNYAGLAYPVDVTVTPTPEPGSLILLGSALPGLAVVLKRRFRRA